MGLVGPSIPASLVSPSGASAVPGPDGSALAAVSCTSAAVVVAVLLGPAASGLSGTTGAAEESDPSPHSVFPAASASASVDVIGLQPGSFGSGPNICAFQVLLSICYAIDLRGKSALTTSGSGKSGESPSFLQLPLSTFVNRGQISTLPLSPPPSQSLSAPAKAEVSHPRMTSAGSVEEQLPLGNPLTVEEVTMDPEAGERANSTLLGLKW